ncbi:MAG: hypothetical protein ICV64_02135 [Thermoleophilia bacterium]|nr:hypothetical protein [Thermoleophilia bacterium]
MVAAVGGASVGSYLFNLIAIRWLGAGDYGEVAALTSLGLLVSLPLAAIQNAVGRDVAALSAGGHSGAVAALFRRWLARMAATGVLLGAATAACTGSIQEHLAIDSRLSVWLTAAAIAAATVLPVGHGMLQGLQRFRWLAASILVWAFARPLLAPPLILLGGVDGAMAATAVAALVPLVISGVAIRRVVGKLPASGAAPRRTRGAPLWPVLLGVTGFAVLTNVDVIVAKAALSAYDAGNYASAALVGKAVLFAATGIALVLLPRATAYLVTDHAALKRAVGRSLVTVSALGLAAATLLLPVPASAVVWLFGPTFGQARELLVPFALAMTPGAVAHVLLTTALAAADRRYPVVLALVAVADVGALWLVGGSAQGILAVTAASCVVAVIAYEAVASWPLRTLLQRETAVQYQGGS